MWSWEEHEKKDEFKKTNITSLIVAVLIVHERLGLLSLGTTCAA